MRKDKTIVLDFDGVIHRYSRGWEDGSIYDPPVFGMKQAIELLRTQYNVVVCSTRCNTPKGMKEVKTWLDRNLIKVDDITCEKPIGICYVDDRAVPFDGQISEMLANIYRIDEGGSLVKQREKYIENGGKDDVNYEVIWHKFKDKIGQYSDKHRQKNSRYCVSISCEDLLKWMSELETKK